MSNVANDGGAIFAIGASGAVTGNMTGNMTSNVDAVMVHLMNITFQFNEANGSGGAVYASTYARVRAQQCMWRDNAADIGGAVAVHESSNLHLMDTAFQANEGRVGGGALAAMSQAVVNMT
eukprot:1156907-Rhodomonas_salina.1